MKKFTEAQFEAVKNFLGNNFIYNRKRRTGNIEVTIEGNRKDSWVLYLRENGKFLWRHIDNYTKYMFPLNMGKRVTKKYWWGETYEAYSIDAAEFETMESALEYFAKYIKKYNKK